MSDDDSLYVAFTLKQHAEISEWADASAGDYDIRIATDHVYLPEVAVVSSKAPSRRVRYLLNPLRDGSLILMRPTAGHWHVTSVRAALDKIHFLEGVVNH